MIRISVGILGNVLRSVYLPIVLIPLLLVGLWFRNHLVYATAESGMPLYNPQYMNEVVSNSWTQFGLGDNMGIRVAGKPTYLFFSVLSDTGLKDFQIQALFFYLVFVTAGIGIAALTGLYFGKLNNKYVLCAVAFYWFNPISLVNVWNRFLYNYMVFWAFLPVGIYIFARGLIRKDIKYALILPLVSLIGSFSWTSPVFVVLLWAICFVVTLIYILTAKIKSIGFYLLYFITGVVAFLLINYWWIGQLFSYSQSSSNIASLGKFLSDFQNYRTLSSLSGMLGYFSSNFRLMEATFATSGPPWASVFGHVVPEAFAFALTGVIMLGLAVYRKNRNVIISGLLIVSALFAMKGVATPFGEVFYLIFTKIPQLQIFRNPFEKFGFVLPLAIAPLLAYLMARLWPQVGLKRYASIFNSVIFIYIYAFLAFPFWTTLVFTRKSGEIPPASVSYETQVPNDYRLANDWLKAQTGVFRFISLPIANEGITYLWNKPYSGADPSNALFNTPNISLNTSIPYYFDVVNNLIRYQIDDRLLELLPSLNVRYILLREDVDTSSRELPAIDVIRAKLDQFVSRGSLSKKQQFGKLGIYEVATVSQKIYSAGDPVYSDESNLISVNNAIPGRVGPRAGIISLDQPNGKLGLRAEDSLVLSPSNIFIPEYSGSENYSVEEVLSRLFYAKYMPDHFLYPLVLLKEKLQQPDILDLNGYTLYSVGILGKRAYEIYQLEKMGADKSLVQATENRYKSNLDLTMPYIKQILENKDKVSRTIKDSLVQQNYLLTFSRSTAAEYLHLALNRLGMVPTYSIPEAENYVIFSFYIPEYRSYDITGNIGFTRGGFVDGKFFGPDIKQLSLDQGVHEIAVRKDLVRLSDNVFKQDYLETDDSSGKTWAFPIPSTPGDYEFSFDFRFKKNDQFNLYFSEDTDTPGKTSFSTSVSKDPVDHQWRNALYYFSSTPGATKGKISIKSIEKEFCRKNTIGLKVCTIEADKYSVELRNISLNRVAKPELFLISVMAEPKKTPGFSPRNDLDSDMSPSLRGNPARMSGEDVINKVSNVNQFPMKVVDWKYLNPTLYEAEIEKTNDLPELLVLSELYDSGWSAYRIDGAGGYKINDHLQVNNYANGWMINQAGRFKVRLSFDPQLKLLLDRRISEVSVIVTFVLLLGFYGYEKYKSKTK